MSGVRKMSSYAWGEQQPVLGHAIEERAAAEVGCAALLRAHIAAGQVCPVPMREWQARHGVAGVA